VRARIGDPCNKLPAVLAFDEWLKLAIASLDRQRYRIVLPEL